ncbi:SIS domain-containing protein [Chlorobium phaeovibrioides]|uniref:SIS domain-containing protein n=1 Tax=Chlorobium phaeovibrioides TaxID=1094 RepID=A0A432ATR3_CHLPH|nr:SIS domain-containing protein [Chlorobium phaeovibrioides]RTY36004.1 SIS domain-containing protein [Chlorobium phaeovibrioides]
MRSLIKSRIQESIEAKQAILGDDTLLAYIHRLAEAMLVTLKRGGKIIFAGNGGSFADAQHLAAEFTSRFTKERNPLPALVLGANSSSMSAIGNDYGYSQVFARELACLARPEDLFLAISTSGNSDNIIRAVDIANEKGLDVWALTGEAGGRLSGMCQCIMVPSTDTGRIQECHIMIGHIVCELVEKNQC